MPAVPDRPGAPALRVTGLFAYPVKAMRAVPLAQALVEPEGFAGDRRWMLVDPEGVAVTQREHPRLALVTAEVLGAGSGAGTGLALAAPGMPALRVPRPVGGPTRTATVWGQGMVVVDAGDAAARWCSTLVGAPVRLVHGAAGAARPVDPDLARPTDAVVFADGFPVHLTVEESLADLNARITDPDHRVTMHRFRPNIVLAGAEPWAEDGWTAVRIGSVPFRVVKPCPRCTVTLVDQRTADRGKEPLRTLATFRRQPDGGVAFGQNLIPDVPPAGATVRVGDEVTVTGRR